MGFELLKQKRLLLPSSTLQGIRKTFVKDPNSPFENDGVFIDKPFDILEASAQPITGMTEKLLSSQLQPDGTLRQGKYFYLSTSTPLRETKEGVDQYYPDTVILKNEFDEDNLYTVLKSDNHLTSEVKRFRYIIVQKPEV